jgi:hypothetical protein
MRHVIILAQIVPSFNHHRQPIELVEEVRTAKAPYIVALVGYASRYWIYYA